MESDLVVDFGRIAQDLQLKKVQVNAVVELLDRGNTVPFITRYRKEMTGGLDEEQIRAIQHRVGQLRQLAERRQTILRTIESQDKLTDDLRASIERAETLKRLEDLYLPYKPKKQTLATVAREKGLGPLADAIWGRDETVSNLAEILPGVINPDKQLNSIEDVLTGVQHILAEKISEDAEVRAVARDIIWAGRLQTSRATTPPAEAPTPTPDGGPTGGLDEFRNYFNYEEPIRHLPPHRALAINRGERRGVLKVKLDFDREKMIELIKERLGLEQHPHREILEKCVIDAVDRLLARSLEREARGEVNERAELHAVEVFARNLRNLLLQPPVHHRRVLAIDPGYRTGCKWAVLDEIGNLIEHGTVFPHLKRKKKKKKKAGSPTTGTDAGEHADDEEESESEEQAISSPPPPDEPPILNADAVHRSTDPESSEDHGLEAEVSKEWEEIKSQGYQGNENSPLKPKPKKQKNKRRKLNPASAGIVIPPPGLWDEENATGGEESPTGEDNTLSRRERAKRAIAEVCKKHKIDVLAIGNGTACRETEELVAEIISEGFSDVPYVIVNEAGASVYSTSPVGREEFPEYDATLRSTISIGRRLQDPLSELVKIDPQNIGVGLYQHDINPRLLKESLSEVVESCVNYVGVDLNTASVPLLRYVSGLNQLRARNIVEHRKQNGPFRSREEIQSVNGIGRETFTQAAGFLKIAGGDQPLDSTWIHPESYPVTLKVLEQIGYTGQLGGSETELEELRAKTRDCNPAAIAEKVEAGEPTIRDILDNLVRPGRDPREDLPKPIFKTGILRIEDLQPHMELKGTVLNVVDFGVFVDIGLKDSGLVHISEVADRFIRSPHDVVSVGDVITTWVLNVDMQRRRVSLTMIDPNRPRPERRPRPQRRGRGPQDQQQQRPPQRQGQEQGEQVAREQTQQRPPRRDGEGQQYQQHRRPPQQGGNRQHHGQGYRQGQQGGHGRGHHREQQPRVIQSRPKERKPPVKLSEDKIAGKQDLHSFGELKALFEHKKHGDSTPKDQQKKSDEPKKEGPEGEK
jgi:transcriptional accessory protein Tex/SPT6